MAKSASSMNISRIALIGAALLALAAVAVQVYRSMNDDKAAGVPAALAEGEAAPSVDEVIAGLEKKLQDNPDDAESWRMLGWSYFETGKFAESATAMKRATTLDPDNAEYWSMLGEALVMASDGQQVPADAADAFRNALKQDPKDPRARYFLAVQKDISGDHKGADERRRCPAPRPAGGDDCQYGRRPRQKTAGQSQGCQRLDHADPQPHAARPDGAGEAGVGPRTGRVQE